MAQIDPSIFRAYDIRGRVAGGVTGESFYYIGRAFGAELARRLAKEHPTVCVGRDARTHSRELENAVIHGLQESGCTVFRIGQTPTPVNSFTVCIGKLDAGVQVTASHNPSDENGLKLAIRGEPFAGEELQQLRVQVEQGTFREAEGRIEEIDGITPYLHHMVEDFQGVGDSLHVVVDSGNGVAGPLYCEILRHIGCRVTELYTEPDGTFPNHPADPAKLETLQDLKERVQSENASLGFAFDGDGDRLGVIDGEGTVRSPDEVLLLLAKDLLTRCPGAPIIFTVSNSSILHSEVKKFGGKPIMTRVGHSFVERAMREYGALLAGEQSGHFFCKEGYEGCDDALRAALKLLQILQREGKGLSHCLSQFPKVYQAQELRPHCPEEEKEKVIRKVTEHFLKRYPVETLDGARIDFGDGAWAGIRQGNTSPCLSICMEARDPKKLQEVERIVLTHLRTYPSLSL